MTNNTILEFRNLTKKYRDLIAVKNLNLDIRSGEILGFVGPNGAGKTTTMKMLGGLIKSTSGTIQIYNEDGSKVNIRENPHELYRRFGFLIDIPAFYGHATPRHILRYYCRLLGIPKDKTDQQIKWALEIVDLSKWIDKPIKEFSKGMTQRLGLAQAIVHDPDVAVLDEPQTGLDPSARIQVRKIMKKLKNLGKTVFLSSHMLYEISEICDRIAIINNGELIAIDKLTNLEQKMTKQEINVELLDPIQDNQVADITKTISSKIKSYTGNNNALPVVYDETLPGFHIYYDGNPTSRKSIHDILSIEMNLPIIGFSKVKTTRLEELYIDLVNENNKKVVAA